MNFGFRVVLRRNSSAHWGNSDPGCYRFVLFVVVVLLNSLTLRWFR